jgi:uncharacterized surface protein with fasciclin (FAS1) repeats
MGTKYKHLNKMNIKNQWYISITMLVLSLSLFMSCKKEKAGQFNLAKQTVFQYISTSKNLTLYQAALKRAGIYNAETFSTGGPFTVFAPVDSAFINAGLTLDSINKYDPQALALVLKYNIIFGKISAASLVGFYAEDVPSQNPKFEPRITKNYYGIFFDGIPLIDGSSVDLGDGALHELKRMPFPPTTDIFDLINKSPDLTFFAAALKHIGYDAMLSVPPPPFPGITGDAALYYTIFAPTNEAYKKFGYPDIAAIYADDPSNLQYYIDTYIIPGKIFTSAFIGGYALDGPNYYVQADGFSIFAIGNVGLTHIIHPDIVTTNGVIHIVDQVIVSH